LPFVEALLADSNVNARDERGCTALHLAAAGAFDLVVASLLRAKAKVNVTDNTGSVVSS
jgi:ankyrin repeat protein